MIRVLRDHLREYLSRQLVRPWALVVPIAVLVVSLPLLRPLRHPSQVGDDELLRMATVRAIVEHGTLAIDRTAPKDSRRIVRSGPALYAEHPPMMAALLSIPAWCMYAVGLSFDDNQHLISYLLTLIGVTLPVAGAAGLIYRMGRLFELPRAWRTALAAACVFASGLLSYAVVLNPHAPAAVLVICCAACLIHVASLKSTRIAAGWIFLAGFCGALAATLDPPAAALALLLMFVIAAYRFGAGFRGLGVVLYFLGAMIPLLVHARLNRPITGDFLPASLHEELARGRQRLARPPPIEDDNLQTDSGQAVRAYSRWIITALLGSHGLFSHFPVAILGIAGVGAVMHRHWPSSTKTLAAATLAGSATIVALYAIWLADWNHAMFASRWFVVFLPLLIFWTGAWARRGRTTGKWALAGTLVGFSVVVTLIGATNPVPAAGFDTYTPLARIRQMFSPAPQAPRGAQAPYPGARRSGIR